MAKTAGYERSLEKWMSEMVGLHPGLTIRLVEGTIVNLHAPYFFGEDFVAGSLIEGQHSDVMAVPYSGIASVNPHSRRV